MNNAHNEYKRTLIISLARRHREVQRPIQKVMRSSDRVHAVTRCEDITTKKHANGT